MAKQEENGAIISTGKDFPKEIADFKLFYQILIVACKLGMIHNAVLELETKISEGTSTIRHSKHMITGA